ncbi:MAG: RNA polymerase subunit sigma-70 [Alphaproteobacteria bacterium]|nr:RNA polymerase subunit sigma-70 [Alphaproteobacteria bacterium]
MTGLALVPVAEAQRREAQAREQAKPRLVVLTAAELLARDLPQREAVLAPWLPTKGVAMIAAARGTGKTWVSLGIAHAVATGGPFLRWNAPQPRKVLLIDGEMAGTSLQERIASLISESAKPLPDPAFLRVMASDLQEQGIPDLATKEGQAQIESAIGDAELLILDNLSTLVRSGDENEAGSWGVMQDWLLSLRRRNISTLLVHHTAKHGDQRGSSRREDILDASIKLKRPDDYRASDGARFIVEYTKARGFFGLDAEPFEAWLQEGPDGKRSWVISPVKADRAEDMRRLKSEGKSVRQIAGELGISKSAVGRILSEAGAS